MKLKIKILKSTAVFLALNIVLEIVAPLAAYALTSGPSQPEVQSFEPVGTTEMVDLFTGDFTYNIPLFELPGPNGGYPFNLHYNSGISMDQEASWVGLGWNMNPGAITRQMRGLPDEFANATIAKKMDMRPNVTIGVGVGVDVEIFGADLKEGTGASLSLSLSIYYNNYKGVGYSTGAGLSASIIKSENGGTSAGLGVNLSLDSQEGVGMNASLSFKDKAGKSDMDYNIGVGYNSKSGLTGLTLAMSATSRQKYRSNVDHLEKNDVRSSIGSSSTISLSSDGYIPSVSMPMRGRNVNITFKGGLTLYGNNANGMVNGYFTTQYLKDKGENVDFPAYGYLNMHKKGANERVMMDFNREKDGQVRANSPNLAIPATNPDIYAVSAQGMAGSYRAFRNDIGLLHDTEEMSNTAGGALGIEIGPGVGPEIGGDISLNYSQSKSGKWSDINAVTAVDFRSGATDDLYEPAYFKAYGEHTADPLDELSFIADDEPVRAELTDIGDKTFKATGNMIAKSGTIKQFTNPSKNREPRNTVLKYIDNKPDSGMESIGPDGTRYRFGQLAKNTKQVECMYSAGPQGSDPEVCNIIELSERKDWTGKNTEEPTHDFANTDQSLSRTEIKTPFPYAYLLTEVLGPDYVDVDGDGQVSDMDAGYWVKFTYTSAIDYKWRAPLKGASYVKGLRTTFEDDKGAYLYGEKQIYYLKQVETKTHKAVFRVSPRMDGYGADTQIQTLNSTLGFTVAQMKLDKIELSSKSDPTKIIKTVNFSYTYKLCRGVDNNIISTSTDILLGGKLTLESIWFTNGNTNTRGRLSPYTFEYASGSSLDENPKYDNLANDRWGNYKPGISCTNIDFPYVEQFDHTLSTQGFQDKANNNSSVWNLKKINLPTGGSIQLQYEAKEYAYVQNKRAMQMFKITGFNESDRDGGAIDLSNSNRRVYFDLEKPIPTGTTAATELNEYFEGVDKLYWNIFMFIRKSTDNDIKDFVSGYNDIASWGFDNTLTTISGTDYYTRAYVDMKKSTIGSRKGTFKDLRYHPFSLAAWQYIRTQNPKLAGVGPFNADPNSNKAAAMAKVKSLVSVIPDIIRIFQGYSNYADSHGWGSKVITDRSYIRLNAPDKIKIGGGCRVKKIMLTDNWAASTANGESNSVYGQVYDYTIEEGGRVISSGVAANEPQVGADESPLRKAKEYTEFIAMKTDNNLFFEYPINESYLPGASIGYRKVTVKSLATAYEAIDTDAATVGNQNLHNIPSGIMTTGATVHEFYTAKEFPAYADETDIEIKQKKLNIPIPLIGQYGEHELTASQGYSIVLNDMHGKLKKVSNFRQSKLGIIEYNDPVSYIEYKYQDETISKDGDTNNDYYRLVNKVNVISGDKYGIVQKSQKFIGQDYEFFTDMREMTSSASSGGLKLNVDVLFIGPIPIPVFVPWPSASNTNNMIRTAVTNKIIHRSGILMSTTAYNAGSIINTKNLYFDELTGQPILISITNDFDAPIYDYTTPAHFVYEGMGPAYKNIGFTFSTTFNTGTGGYIVVIGSAASYDALLAGDEFITSGNGKGTIVRLLGNNTVFATMKKNGATGSTCTIIRSGRRNLVAATAGNIKTLGVKNDNITGNPVDGR